MTKVATALTGHTDSAAAGNALAEQLALGLHGQRPDAVIVFASSQHDYEELLQALHIACQPGVLVGCSSAGEFTSAAMMEGAASAIAIQSDDMAFSASLGRCLREDRESAAAAIVEGFRGLLGDSYRYRYALILTDALAGHADDLVHELTQRTGGTYAFFGGGAGDDARFSRTHVFSGTRAYPDAVVALEILSNKPLGIGVRHGWQPAGDPLRVTAVEGMRLVSLNAAPAVEAVEEHAHATGQTFDPTEPLPYFLQNVFGVDTGAGYALRVPLAVEADGSIACAADIPEGATVHMMRTSAASAADAAESATRDALSQLGGLQPKAALFFDCVATRLRSGGAFGDELGRVRELLGSDAPYAGCNTYGQIARAEGQFSGFHNCTAVVCVIPE